MPVPALLLAVGGCLLVAGWLAVRASGAQVALGRRLAGARQLRVGEVLDAAADRLPPRPVRIAGRIRCPDPLHTVDDERLVAYHRDVEVRVAGGRWLTIERVRETRSFDLWDHDESLSLDPALAAEPLIVIPGHWQGGPAELGSAYATALERVSAEHGPPIEARAITRSLSVVDRLLVLAEVRRGTGGGIVLAPPSGGFVLCGLELDEAMRVLAGPRRRWMLAGTATMALGGLALVAGVLSGLLAAAA